MARPRGLVQSGLVQFLASGPGRLLRIVAGLVLVVVGLWLVRGTWGYVLVVIGLVPIAAGLFDFCLLTAIFGGPFWGRDVRAARR